MKNENITAVCFKIQPPANSLVEKLQQLEYLIFTDGLRKLLGVVICLVGQGVLWRVDRLNELLQQHSGKFEGDDLELTMLAALQKPNEESIRYERSRMVITTKLKPTWTDLFVQRSRIWAFGLIRACFDTRGIFVQRGRYGAFYRGVFISEILAHPFKLMLLPTIVLITIATFILLVR